MAEQKRKRDKISDDGDGLPERKPSTIPFGSPPSILKPSTEAPSPSPNLPTLPNDIIYKIMKYCEMGTLNSCLRVSKEFYQAAGPLLYRDIEVNYGKTVWRINGGLTKVDRPATKDQPAAVNLKRQLLSYVQRLIVTSHRCQDTRFDASSLPNLHTLLDIPYLDSTSLKTEGFCDSASVCNSQCAILSGAQPRTVVIDNSYGFQSSAAKLDFRISSPVLTLALSDAFWSIGTYWPPWLREMGSLPDIDQDALEEVRIIVSRAPYYIDVLAQGGDIMFYDTSIQILVNHILVPVLADSKVPITVYLFRQLPKNFGSEKLIEAIEKDLDARHERCQRVDRAEDRHHPSYTIKTLTDYINEGVEDEFIWQELHYWRRVNRRRIEEEWRVQQKAREKKQRGEQHGVQAES